MNAGTPRDPRARPTRWVSLALFVVGCQLVGILGALTTGTGTTPWYQALAKPAFQPPGWVFGPVWTLLYLAMGIAAWRVWSLSRDVEGRRRALVLFGVQLLLNALWSPVFFGAHRIGLALVILIALWIALAATLRSFWGLERLAAWLLVPYLAWVSFAAVLNAAILHLN